MIQEIVQFLVSGILNIVVFIVSVIFYPIYALITSIFPDFTSFWAQAITFYNNQLLTGVAFLREVFFNITGYPRDLFNLIIGYFIARLLIHVSVTAVNFIINAWGLIKGGRSNG